MRISVFSLGCKVNQYEGGGLVASLIKQGYDAAEGLEPADIFIINTCAVTNEAERKSRQAISRVKKLNKDAKIIVCGCASQSNHEQFKLRDVVFIKGTAGKNAIVDEIAKIEQANVGENCTLKIDIDSLPLVYGNESCLHNKTRAFVKIADGCNNFCSYCIVPYLRGRLRSRALADVLLEINEVSRQFKEIVLIGIDISSYGKDIGLSLPELITAIGEYRLRLGSLEVGSINENLLSALKKNKEFCHHFHLSLQSGSDEILRKMNRKYCACDYEESVILIKKYFPEAIITTDIIAGFPAETDENHIETLSFVKKIGFNDIHIFEYSSKRGTPASKMPQLDGVVKRKRANELMKLKNELKAEWAVTMKGKNVSVLIEGRSKNYFFGHEKGFMKVYIKNSELSINTIYDIVVGEPYGDGVLGEVR